MKERSTAASRHLHAARFSAGFLVVVLVGLCVFREHQQVHPAPLLVGAVAINVGAVLVATA